MRMDGFLPLLFGALIFGLASAFLGHWFAPVVALGGFLWRWYAEIRRLEPDREIDGRPFYSRLGYRYVPVSDHQLRGDRGRDVVAGFSIGLGFGTTSRFTLHPEAAEAQPLSLHLSQEPAAEPSLEEAVRVSADSDDFIAYWKNNKGARDAVRAAFAAGVRAVWADGRILWAAWRSSESASEKDEQMLSTLVKAFEPFETSTPRRWTFARLTSTFVDGLVCAIASVGIADAIKMVLEEWDLHVDAYDLLPPAFLISVAVALGVVALAVVLHRGSPGIRDMLVGRVGIILLTLPFASLQVASDINTWMDSSRPVIVPRTITGKFNHGQFGTGRHIVLSPEPSRDLMKGPRKEVRVSSYQYDRARPGGVLRLTIGRGRLGIPWYRHIDVLGGSGEAPPPRQSPF